MGSAKVNAAKAEGAAFAFGMLANEYRFLLTQLLVMLGLDAERYEQEIEVVQKQLEGCLNRSQAKSLAKDLPDSVTRRLADIQLRLISLHNESQTIKELIALEMGQHFAARNPRWVDDLQCRVRGLSLLLRISIDDAILPELSHDDFSSTIEFLLPDGPLRNSASIENALRRAALLDHSMQSLLSFTSIDCETRLLKPFLLGYLLDQGRHPSDVISFMFEEPSAFAIAAATSTSSRMSRGSPMRSYIARVSGSLPETRVIESGVIPPPTVWYLNLNIALRCFPWWKKVAKPLNKLDSSKRHLRSLVDARHWQKTFEQLQKAIGRELCHPSKPKNDARGAWIYKQRRQRVSEHDVIKKLEVNKKGWAVPESESAVGLAAKRYAERYELPPVGSAQGKSKGIPGRNPKVSKKKKTS